MEFATALELFDDEEFEDASAAFTKALAATQDPAVTAKILEKRAISYLKINQFETAAEDASASLKINPSQNSYLTKGESLFQMDEYESAKKAFETGMLLKGETGKKAATFQKWIRKCNAEIEDEEDDDDDEDDAPQEEKNTKVSEEKVEAVAPVAATPQPKFRHDWYQTSDMVVITVMAKKQNAENVSVDITATNVTVEIKLDDGSGSSFVLDLDLFDEIVPATSTHRLSPFKLEVKLRKKTSYKWNGLEASDATMTSRLPTSSSTTTSDTSSTSVPSAYAGNKDWNAIERQLKKEEDEEKPEGEEALNALFRQIYGNANEDTRRAMNKSFQTSGGTVLSTNWGEVGEKDYEKERQAPEGMQWKNWDGNKLDKEGNPIKEKDRD